MQSRTLGYRSELLIHRVVGVLREREGYTVVATPSLPPIEWLNYLVYPSAPRRGDCAAWMAAFQEEFSDDTIRGGMAFGWDSPNDPGDLSEFEAAGFESEFEDVFVTARCVEPPRLNQDLRIHPITADRDWDALVKLHAAHKREIGSEGIEVQQQIIDLRRRRMAASAGVCYGAYLNDDLVGALDLYYVGGLGRYKNVLTHPGHRRLAVCSTLVFETAKRTLERTDVEELVIITDERNRVRSIYESVGFKAVEKRFGILSSNSGPALSQL